jgi:hypothetical protein
MLPDPHGYFTNDELSELKAVYVALCNELGIAASSDLDPLRERVASLIMEFARAGERDSAAIRRHVLGRFAPRRATHTPTGNVC